MKSTERVSIYVNRREPPGSPLWQQEINYDGKVYTCVCEERHSHLSAPLAHAGLAPLTGVATHLFREQKPILLLVHEIERFFYVQSLIG